MTDAPTDNSTEAPDRSDVPDEYRMSRGQRPDRIRRRNLITGIVLVLAIATFMGITIYTRATSEEASYGVEEEARPPFGGEQGEQQPSNPDDK